MSSGTFQCAASADDAVDNGGDTTSITETAPNIDDTTWSWMGLRFPSVNIAQGSTINSAVLRVVISDAGMDEPNLDIFGEDVDNSAQYTGGATNNVSSRTRTSAHVAWANTNLGAPGTFDSPDLSTIISEIVSRGGWVSGNALSLIIQTVGTTSRDFAPTHYDGTPANAPQLLVDWTEGGGGGASATNKFLPILGAG